MRVQSKLLGRFFLKLFNISAESSMFAFGNRTNSMIVVNIKTKKNPKKSCLFLQKWHPFANG